MQVAATVAEGLVLLRIIRKVSYYLQRLAIAGWSIVWTSLNDVNLFTSNCCISTLLKWFSVEFESLNKFEAHQPARICNHFAYIFCLISSTEYLHDSAVARYNTVLYYIFFPRGTNVTWQREEMNKKTDLVIRRWRYEQCDQIGLLFLKVLETYSLTKLAQILGNLLCFFKNHSFYVKIALAPFWATLVKIGLLLF